MFCWNCTRKKNMFYGILCLFSTKVCKQWFINSARVYINRGGVYINTGAVYK